MQPCGLVGLGKDTIDVSSSELCQIFEVLASSKDYPLLIHCTQGKDRTGLVMILLLLMLEIPVNAISEDYTLSEPELLPEKESRLQEIREINLSDDFAGCPVGFVEQMERHIQHTYGGIQNYLEHIGVTAAMQRTIKNTLSI